MIKHHEHRDAIGSTQIEKGSTNGIVGPFQFQQCGPCIYTPQTTRVEWCTEWFKEQNLHSVITHVEFSNNRVALRIGGSNLSLNVSIILTITAGLSFGGVRARTHASAHAWRNRGVCYNARLGNPRRVVDIAINRSISSFDPTNSWTQTICPRRTAWSDRHFDQYWDHVTYNYGSAGTKGIRNSFEAEGGKSMYFPSNGHRFAPQICM